MAKFDFNRTTGGTLELVRDASGNYSVNKVGFTRLPSLNLPDLTGSAVTPPKTIGPVPLDPTPKDETIEGQTAQAFQTGDDERKDFTNESMLKTAEQTSNLLNDSFAKTRKKMTSDDVYRGITIKDPTENIVGYDDAYIEDQKRKESGQYNLDDLLMDLPKDTRVSNENIIIPLKKPKQDLPVTSSNVQEGLVKPPLKDFADKVIDALKGDRFKEGTEFARPVEGTIDQAAIDRSPPKETLGISTPSTEQFQRQTTLPTQVDTQSAIGSYMDESVYNVDQPVTGIKGPPSVISGPQVEPVKRNALETVNTSLKKVFETFSPIGALARELGRPVGESPGAVAYNISTFQTRGDLGSSTDPGRIVGNPSKDLYAGMNRVSNAFLLTGST